MLITIICLASIIIAIIISTIISRLCFKITFKQQWQNISSFFQIIYRNTISLISNICMKIIDTLYKIWLKATLLIKKFLNILINNIRNFMRWLIRENWITTFRPFFLGLFPFVIVAYLLLGISGKVPEILYTNLVIISATFGSLVFAGAAFQRRTTNTRRQLMRIARLFIYATILFLFFYLGFSIVNIMRIDPFSIEVSQVGFSRAVVFWFVAAGMYGGSYLFSRALIDFLIILKNII